MHQEQGSGCWSVSRESCEPPSVDENDRCDFLVGCLRRREADLQQWTQKSADREPNYDPRRHLQSRCPSSHSSSSSLPCNEVVRRSANTTDRVSVPTSEHVAEIVGRQGCKIKELRHRTNTYIKTPARNEDPVFLVTGRENDVRRARLEIEAAARHFSLLRANRKQSSHNGEDKQQQQQLQQHQQNEPQSKKRQHR